ncbi:hypothetical protein DV737_g3478, partial [Chaetothyriales sp. CBS 132003]
MRDSSAVQWDGRRQIAIFIRSLHLLDLDLLEDWPGVSEHTFTPRALQQNLQQRVKGVEWALFRLFELYSPTEARDKLRPFFPPLTSLQSVNLRAALLRALTELKKNGALPKDIVLRKTMLDECKGERLEELLAAFSMLVLRKTLSRSAACSPVSEISERAIGMSAVPDPECGPLILAYRVSLQQVLSQRRRVETEASAKKAQLDRRAQSLSQRRARALEQVPAIEPLERGRVVGLLKDEWTGDDQWIKAILYETIAEFDGDAGHANAHSFKQHQSIRPRLDPKAAEGDGNGIRDEHLLAPFAAILHHLDSELGSPQCLTIGKNNQPSRPNGRESPRLPPGQDPEKETTSPPKPLSSDFSWLDESEARSRGNDDSLLSLSIHATGQVPSFADRVRRPQAPLFSSDVDYTSDVAEMPSVLAEKGAGNGGQATAVLPTESKGTLLERTRQSMAASNAKARPKRKAARTATSQVFPTNPFETPRRSSITGGGRSSIAGDGRSSIMGDGRSSIMGGGGRSMALPSSSKESTPREQLFSDEAESASIFKSRPRLAQSPISLAAAASGPDDSALAGEMTILDIGSSDVGFGSE